MSNKMGVLDLFCGCGGLSKGFEMAGYEILIGIDNDKSALNTFENNHENAKTMGEDITKVEGKDILDMTEGRNIDIVLGGPPCQGLSLSGPRKFHDPRNRLFLSYVKLADQLKPYAFVLENVPGLVGLFGGKIKDAIIKEFTKIGYDVKYDTLLAADFGVPQTRRRVFFVGVRNGTKFSFPKRTHFASDTLFKHKKHITCEEAISDLPALEDGDGSERQEYPLPSANDYQRFAREGSQYIYNHIATNHTEKVKKIISIVPDGGNYKNLPEKYRNTRNFNIAWTRYSSTKPAPTIDTGHRHHFHYKYNRVPTVRENARLQSFPDTFIFTGNKSEQNRQVGNAVSPLLAFRIAQELKKCL